MSGIWLIERTHYYHGYNGRECDVTPDLDYGYFTSKEACQTACDKLNEPLRAELEKWNKRERDEHAKQVGRRAAAIAQNEVLEPAGLPLVPIPHVGANVYQKTWMGSHEDSMYYEPVEIEEAS